MGHCIRKVVRSRRKCCGSLTLGIETTHLTRQSELALSARVVLVPEAAEDDAMAQTHSTKNWSADVTEHSDALDLEPKVFEKESAAAIAKSLKRSAERSVRRKTGAYRSAMSMLTFYINRAGRNLPSKRKQTLEAAKEKLRQLFGRAG
jgi:hypothetical protein